MAPRFPLADIRQRQSRSPTQYRVGSAKPESAMSTKQVHTCPDLASGSRPSMAARFKTLGRGVVMAGAVAALSLTAAPTPASAHGPGVGAAIGLGILGGVIAGAAIAAATPPVYAAPPSYYYYPQQGYYYDNTPPPAYYYAPQPYYGSAGYSYPPSNYQ